MHAIGKIVRNFEDTGVITNIERSVHHCFTCSTENMALISETIAEDPNVSIPRRSQELFCI